jgi:acyl dehydratase
MTALYFEDFTAGEVYTPAARTVTEADVVAFTGISNDSNPVHTDAEFAAGTMFGERIAHGLLGLAAAGGFLSRVGVVDGTAIALLGVEWAFRGPIRFGDTVRAEITVRDARPTANGTRGIVTFAFRLVNHREELVQEGTHVFMVACRPRPGLVAAPPGASGRDHNGELDGGPVASGGAR